MPGSILMHRQQARDSDSLGEKLPHSVAGRFGSNHQHVHIIGRSHGAKVDAEAVGEHQGAVGPEIGRYLLPINVSLQVIRNQYHEHVGHLGHFRNVGYFQPGIAGNGATAAFRIEAHHHLLAGVLQVQGVGMPLASVANYADSLAL